MWKDCFPRKIFLYVTLVGIFNMITRIDFPKNSRLQYHQHNYLTFESYRPTFEHYTLFFIEPKFFITLILLTEFSRSNLT